MIPGELERMAEKIMSTKKPEDLFGTEDKNSVDHMYKVLVRIVHPDKYWGNVEAKNLATVAFQRLGGLYGEANKKLDRGSYGKRYEVTIQSRKRTYTMGDVSREDFISNLYEGFYTEMGTENKVLMRVPVDSEDNDLIKNEATALKKIHGSDLDSTFFAYVPRLLESFAYKDESDRKLRNVNIFPYTSGMYTLEQVRTRYPKGIDLKDMAWIWRRLLLAMGVAHQSGVVHGAIIPASVLIHPEYHGLVLFDWAYSAENGGKIKAIFDDYRAWYPEVEPAKARPARDIYMGACSMIQLIGGNAERLEFPDSVPRSLKAFFRGCILSNPGSAWDLIAEFDELIVKLWGPKKFHPFSMTTS